MWRKFPTLQMPSLYPKITVIQEKSSENSDLNHFRWGWCRLVICLVDLCSKNSWRRCPSTDIFKQSTFQRDATRASLIVRNSLSQTRNHVCTCVCVCEEPMASYRETCVMDFICTEVLVATHSLRHTSHPGFSELLDWDCGSLFKQTWSVNLMWSEWRHSPCSGRPWTRGYWHYFPTPNIVKHPPRHSTRVHFLPISAICVSPGGNIGPAESNPCALGSPRSRPLLLAGGLDMPPAFAHVTSSY